MSRPRLIAIVAVVLALAGLLLWLAQRPDGGDRAGARDAATPSRAHGPNRKPPGESGRASLNDLLAKLRGAKRPDDEHKAGQRGRSARLARFKVAGLFDKDCMFGVDGHCKTWGTLARRCDDGDADACVRLGKLLIADSPSQPLWGALLLRKACALDHQADVCDLGEKWNRWARYGYKPDDDGAPIPDDLDAACDAGDQVACGLIQMRNSHRGKLDETAALASCRAGFRDVCATLITSGKTVDTAIAALKAGCDLPDAWMCFHLGNFYDPACAKDPKARCAEPNAERAARYRRLACRLAPEMHPCKN